MYKIVVRFKSTEEEEFSSTSGNVFTEGMSDHRLVSFVTESGKRVYNLDSVESFEIAETIEMSEVPRP